LINKKGTLYLFWQPQHSFQNNSKVKDLNKFTKGCMLVACGFFYALGTLAQNQDPKVSLGEIHGNFQADAQYYNPDTLIGAPAVPEKMLLNGFANINYTRNNFSAGLRYESYLNALQGFDPRYKGSGIPYRYASYRMDELEVTVGNYYEQFGNGVILRAYEERGLGYDNAMDGLRVKYMPVKGLYLKGVVGQQRAFFDKGQGIVRGFDGEIFLNDLINAATNDTADRKLKFTIGGSFVSKYQPDQDPVYNLPQNVGASAGRINIIFGDFSIGSEYAYKINDPSTANGYNYKNGEVLLLMANYSRTGFAASIRAKHIDNMNYRSDRSALGNALLINYLPAFTKQHTYGLLTFYPYATQLNGEAGMEAEVFWKLKKGSKIGGPFGTEILINYSAVNGLDTVHVNDESGRRFIYKVNYFGSKPDGEIAPGVKDQTWFGEVYFRDFVFEINRKFTKKLKATLVYSNQVYNMEVIQGLKGKPVVYSNIGVADVTYRLKPGTAVRVEAQGLFTNQDMGSWASLLGEFTPNSNWFIAVQDQYNYGNKDEKKQLHYLTGSVGYIKNANRFTLSYGRQRAGIFCVGGVCRNVPASNGVTLSITSSF
jgi:hypothetical protein